MKKLVMTALFSTLLMTTGCATQRALVSPSASQSVGYEKAETFFVGGIGQQKTVDAAAACGGSNRVAGVESKLNAKDIVFGMLTLGIYTPRTATVYCR